MSNKHSRAGGKFTGNHTSLIPAAALIADIAHNCDVVTKITPGFIKAGLSSARGKRRLKITISDSQLLLAVRDNISQQEVHVYATDLTAATRAIEAGAARAGIQVTTRHP